MGVGGASTIILTTVTSILLAQAESTKTIEVVTLVVVGAILVALLRVTSKVSGKCENLPILINSLQPENVEHWQQQDLLVRSIRHSEPGWRNFNVLMTPKLATRMLYALLSALAIIVNELVRGS